MSQSFRWGSPVISDQPPEGCALRCGQKVWVGELKGVVSGFVMRDPQDDIPYGEGCIEVTLDNLWCYSCAGGRVHMDAATYRTEVTQLVADMISKHGEAGVPFAGGPHRSTLLCDPRSVLPRSDDTTN